MLKWGNLVLCFLTFNIKAQERLLTKEDIQKLNNKQKIEALLEAPDNKKLELFNTFITEFHNIQKKAKKENDRELLEMSELLQCIVLSQKHKYKEAIPRLIELLNTNTTLNDNYIKSIYQHIITGYVAVKNLPKAFEYHMALETFLSENNIVPGPWDYGVSKSMLFAELGMIKEAIAQLDSEWQKTSYKYKDYWYAANYLNNKGVYYNKIKKPDSAIVYFKKALQVLDTANIIQKSKSSYKFFVGLIKGNIGQSFMHKKDFRQAIPLLIEDIKYSTLNNDILNAAISANELARCYLELGYKDSCLFFLKKSSEWLADKDDYQPRVQNKQLYAEYLLANQKWKDAAQELLEINRLKDSILTEEKENQVLNHQIALSISEKIKELALKDKIIKEEEAIILKESNKRKLLLLVLGFITVLLIIVAIYYSKLKRSKDELTQKNQQIENALKEKEFLIKEVHHRVKNNLQVIASLLSLQISKTDNKQLIVELAEIRQRINSIGKMHEFLYRSENLSLIRFNDYVDELVKNISEIFYTKQRKIIFTISIEPVIFDLDTALPLGLLLNELISNSMKHAFNFNQNGEISIELKSEGEYNFVLTVADNGKGMKAEDMYNSDSLGMEIINLMSQQLGGYPHLHSVNGTKFVLKFRPAGYVQV